MTDLRLDQLVEDVGAELERTGRGRVDVYAEPTVVRGDPNLIRVAVRNLLDNALRHGGGEDDDLPSATVTVAHGSVTVGDRGPGIPAAARTPASDVSARRRRAVPASASRSPPGSPSFTVAS